jgi:hypothetical protein
MMSNWSWVRAVANVALGASMALIFIVVFAAPDKWDRATAIGVCGGLPVLRQENGTVWLRVSSMRAYRIEDKDKLECR